MNAARTGPTDRGQRCGPNWESRAGAPGRTSRPAPWVVRGCDHPGRRPLPVDRRSGHRADRPHGGRSRVLTGRCGCRRVRAPPIDADRRRGRPKSGGRRKWDGRRRWADPSSRDGRYQSDGLNPWDGRYLSDGLNPWDGRHQSDGWTRRNCSWTTGDPTRDGHSGTRPRTRIGGHCCHRARWGGQRPTSAGRYHRSNADPTIRRDRLRGRLRQQNAHCRRDAGRRGRMIRCSVHPRRTVARRGRRLRTGLGSDCHGDGRQAQSWRCCLSSLIGVLAVEMCPECTKAAPKGGFRERMSGGVLLSHTVTRAVPSALRGLASGFGMGPGVSLSL